MKGKKFAFGLTMILAFAASNVGAQEYTLTPDGTYVGGNTSTLAPDGTYVGGSDNW